MADTVLNKLINEEYDLDSFIKWLRNDSEQDYKCSRSEFVIYFLNFLHEEVSKLCRTVSTPKNNTPKRLEQHKNQNRDFKRKGNLFPVNESINTTPNRSLNCSISSPISPLYQETANFSSTPKQSRRNTPLRLGNFIVDKSFKKKPEPDSSEKKLSRRINPTNLNQKRFNQFVTNENSFNFQASEASAVEDLPNRNLSGKLKVLTEPPNVIPKVKVNETTVDINQVTCKRKLDTVARIYSVLLSEKLVLNLNTEVYFVVTIFLSKSCNGANAKENLEIFRSIHNLVYFATKCLEEMIWILGFYDKSTLKLFCQHPRLQRFSPYLNDKLKEICESKQERVVEVQGEIKNVCFNVDTDNREWFPSDASFHAFRKQRDLFYDILRIWECNHLLNGWSFSVTLGGKIKTLLSLTSEPANFLHLTRLFKTQLLGSCGKTLDEKGEFSWPKIDAEKLTRLRSRLVTKGASNGLNNPPTFPGHQEFFKNFITTASHFVFNRYLVDTLITEIKELDSSFDQDPDCEVDKTSFLTLLKSLRILAKFLGFIEALPYKSEHSLKHNQIEALIQARSQLCPQLDIKTLLSQSKKDKFVLTIPWMVKYLAMLDSTTLRLPYYRQVLDILFSLYKNLSVQNFNDAVLLFSLGWLFELPHFPDTFYFDISNSSLDKNDSKLSLADQNILYYCCPYLDEIKKLLGNVNQQSSVTVKHITPITAPAATCAELAKKRLEAQLEEAFFNGQPLSLRKTVEFVSERVASACVKHICNELVPRSKAEVRKEVVKSKGNEDLAQRELEKLILKCQADSLQMAKAKVEASLEGLLSSDVLVETKQVCIGITIKHCFIRVKEWINSHVTVNIYLKDLKVGKNDEPKPIFALPSEGNQVEHKEDTVSPAWLLQDLNKLTVDVIESKETGEIVKVFEEAQRTLTQRRDVNQFANLYICKASLDLVTNLAIYRPGFLNQNLKNKFVEIIKAYYATSEDLFKNLLSPRNLAMFALSKDQTKSWKAYADLISVLVKEKVLSIESLEEQCTALFRIDHDEVTLMNLSMFLKQLSSGLGSGSNEKLLLLLDFLSDFCYDL